MTRPAPFVDTLLLIALPASGKSEFRRFLMHMDRDRRVSEFHLSDTVQLDDYPYVEFMREVDDALAELERPGVFFEGLDGRFVDGRDWGTLLHLVNEDWAVVTNPKTPTPDADPAALLNRLDRARALVGAPPVAASWDHGLARRVAERLEPKAAWVYHELFSARPETIEDKTVVIEFARGGPEGASMPLQPPHGYAWNLAQLRPEILERAAALYIWVTPEESRRKNAARAVPGATNTVIFHAAPEVVMRQDYGIDDIGWLVDHARKPDTLPIDAHGRRWDLPFGRFDNRVDKTTFVRDDPESWAPEDVDALETSVSSALDGLWSAWQARERD